MKFTERPPLEKGFAEVFANEVQPQLNEFEFERKAVLKKTYLTMAMLPAIALGLIGAVYAISGAEYMVPAILLSVLFAGAGMVAVWGSAAGKWGSKVKDVAMPAICNHVGYLTYSASGQAFALDIMKDMRLLPKHDNAALRSLLRGTHNGTDFEMVHATLTSTHTDSENRRRTTTDFKGLLFRIEMPERAPGRIALMRDRGGVGNKLAETFAFGSTRSLPKVTFDHAAFEAAFEVYADNPDAAKAFLPDTMLDALLQIGQSHGQGQGTKAFVGGFHGNSFYMALQRQGHFMKMGNLTTPVDQIEDDLHGIFDDIALSHGVVDRLKSARGQGPSLDPAPLI